MPLAGHLNRVTMQKVPQILRQKPGKISKNDVFPIEKRQKQHTLMCDKNSTHYKEKY